MIGKNISDMSSFSYAMKFIDKIKNNETKKVWVKIF